MALKTLIIDDEPDAVNFIHSLITEYCPQLEIAGTARSVKEARKMIIKTQPDLLFLDVEMLMAAALIYWIVFLKKLLMSFLLLHLIITQSML